MMTNRTRPRLSYPVGARKMVVHRWTTLPSRVRGCSPLAYWG